MPLGLSPKVPGGGGGGVGDIFHPGVNDGDIVKRLGDKLDKVTGISELLIVAAHALATFTNNSASNEKGAEVTSYTLTWTYNRNSDNPTSQSINQGIGAVPVADRNYISGAVSITTNTTFTISAVGDDGNATSLNTTMTFYNRRYYGVDDNLYTTGAEIMTNIAPQAGVFGTSKAANLTFNASLGTPPNYLYIAYPKSWGLPAYTTLGGFVFSDYTVVESSLTNASGHTEDYYILRTNNKYNSSSLQWNIY